MTNRREIVRACVLCLWFGTTLLGQSTQALISGRVVDSSQGTPIADVTVAYLSLATNTGGAVRTNSVGYYVAPLLPPGKYRLRVSKEKYQAQEIHDLELPVASSLAINFKLRPLRDVWEEGQYKSIFLPGTNSVLTFYGPDVDSTHLAVVDINRGALSPLETSISTVIDPTYIRELPLAGRDVYATLVLQPGVTATTSTARGLGVSINGQRPSSSNYLLDGVENNNYLITGPLTTVAPEAVQEYRISISNYSAEYGRTSGFVANAVTQSGGNTWHGIGYFNIKNDALNANTFDHNANLLSRNPLKEDELGFQVGGPIRKGLYTSTAFEYLRSRSFQDPVKTVLPTTSFLAVVADIPDSIANKLLKTYQPPLVTGADLIAPATLIPPSFIDRYLGLERIDYVSPTGSQHVMGRVSMARLSNPDFIWSPYKDFISGLDNNTNAIALAWTSSLRPSLTNELRGSWSSNLLQWDRAHPEIPTLVSEALLPGSPAFYAFKNHGTNWEVLDNLVWSRQRHIVQAGGGILFRRLDGYLTAGRDGQVRFDNLTDFALDAPSVAFISTGRQNQAGYQTPDFNRKYSYHQYFLFAQDSFRVTSRLVINYGLRYENFGAPHNVGATQNALLVLGPGNDFPARLSSAQLTFPQAGGQAQYQADNNDWSVRLGFAYSLRNDSKTLLRGGYGMFYDRPFDNLWQNLANNNFVLAQASFDPPVTTNYLVPPSNFLAGVPLDPVADFPKLTFYQPGIRDGYVQDYFLGIQQQVSGNLSVEMNATGSLGRKLITTDLINRPYSVPTTDIARPYNPELPQISYRSNQGTSEYNALTMLARYRGRRAQFQAAYTWSHSIDNQSDPLLNDFFDLSFTGSGGGSVNRQIASFSRQFDSRADRASSDFDQRHNLVFFGSAELPPGFSGAKAAPLFRGWRISGVSAIRSGFPFSVLGFTGQPLTTGGGNLEPSRADLIDPQNATSYVPVAGGVRLLNPDAFQKPASGQQGNTGRNEFRGPGLFSVDFSLSRSMAVKWLGESGRITLRADAFNVLNHANLNNPANTSVGSADPAAPFGVARFGRTDRNASFPAVTPFNETARQIQLILRIQF